MLGAGVAISAGAGASGAARPTLHAARGCYLVKQPVRLHGAGFAPLRTYVVSIDGVYFGQATTDARGTLKPRPILPGGLPAGYAQSVEHVEASDGSSVARTRFTLTRPAGARFLRTSGRGTGIRAPIEIWGYSRTGRRRRVYLHYVDPSGRARANTSLGRTTGQCGYMRTKAVRLFPVSPSPGTWTFQVDTRPHYSRHVAGPVHRITVAVR